MDRPAEMDAISLLEVALGAAAAASIRAAVQLAIADVVDDEEPLSIKCLAERVGAERDALTRLLRLLRWHGIFEERADGTIQHTPMSRLLKTQAPTSLKHLMLWMTEPWMWALWDQLDVAVVKGRDVFVDAYGASFFDTLHTDWPQSARVFEQAMSEWSAISAAQLADVIPLAGVRTIVDVAGGQGHLLATMLEHNPEVRGILLELPGVMEHVDPRLLPQGALGDRSSLIPGDCRVTVTSAHADVYLFKNILGLGDGDATTILKNAAASAPPGARMFIIENLVDEGAGKVFSSAMDLRMLVTVGGRKHTRETLISLVERAGLSVVGVEGLDSCQHVLEACVTPRDDPLPAAQTLQPPAPASD